jgi:hypothetical protein
MFNTLFCILGATNLITAISLDLLRDNPLVNKQHACGYIGKWVELITQAFILQRQHLSFRLRRIGIIRKGGF